MQGRAVSICRRAEESSASHGSRRPWLRVDLEGPSVLVFYGGRRVLRITRSPCVSWGTRAAPSGVRENTPREAGLSVALALY
jgi:hypothetical protein